MPVTEVILHPYASPESRSQAPLLFADHRGGSAVLYEALRARGMCLRRTHNLSETLGALQAGVHRSILLDPVGPGSVELAAILERRHDIPVLITFDPAAPEATLAAVEAMVDGRGALIDPIARGGSAGEVAMRVAALDRVVGWRHRASHDERTECLRPEAFENRLVEIFSAARRHRFPMALALLDLDDFGRVNKRHDHTVGDRVIERLGQVLRASLRAEDLAGRLGGDEFAMALPFTDSAEGSGCVARVLADLAQTPVEATEGSRVYVTASAGLAVFDPGDDIQLPLIRRRAELALRAAKGRGGNGVIAWRDREVEENLAVAE